MVRYIVVIGLAGLLGILSANYIVQGRAGLVNKTSGQWVWWPSAGSTAIDPYTRSYFLAQHRLPMSKFETFEAETTRDKAGRPLSADCVYEFNGSVPEARWWSLVSFSPDDAVVDDVPNQTLSAHDVIAESDGSVTITVSQEIQPGNWISPGSHDEFVLLLRLYNPISKLGSGAAFATEMPDVVRRSCR